MHSAVTILGAPWEQTGEHSAPGIFRAKRAGRTLSSTAQERIRWPKCPSASNTPVHWSEKLALAIAGVAMTTPMDARTKFLLEANDRCPWEMTPVTLVRKA